MWVHSHRLCFPLMKTGFPCLLPFLHILRPTKSKMCHCGFVLHMSYSSSWILIPIIIVQNWCAAGKLIGKSFPIGKDSFIKNFHNWHIPNISQVIEKQKVCLFLSPMIYVSQGSVFNIKLFTNDVFVLHFKAVEIWRQQYWRTATFTQSLLEC